MAEGPGIYSDIGKKARDLLYKDYHNDHKFTITTYSPTGVAIMSSGTQKGEEFLADISTKFSSGGSAYDVKLDTNSVLSLTVSTDNAIPGLKTITTYSIPDQLVSKCEAQLFYDYARICFSRGMASNTINNVSAVVGTNVAKVGIEFACDDITRNLTKFNVGLGFSSADFIAALALNDKGDTLNASYYHIVNPLTNTVVGAEVNHIFSTNENTITFGTQHSLDQLTTVKARVNNLGKASAVIQHEWRPKSLFTLSGEVDTKAIDKSAKFGLALALEA